MITTATPHQRPRRLLALTVPLPATALISAGSAVAAAPGDGAPSAKSKPTIVLVHGS